MLLPLKVAAAEDVRVPVLKGLSLDLYRRELIGKPCRRVRASDDVRDLVEEMADFAREHNAGGLAAPQVGYYVQLAIVLEPRCAVTVLVNPEIKSLGGRDILDTEGCLSLPPANEATARIWRSEIAHIETGTVQNPDARQMRTLRGFTARVAQHEIDHLQGLFFIDRVQPIARNIVLKRYERYLKEQG